MAVNMAAKIGIAGMLVWLTVAIGMIYGWIHNIISLIGSDFSHITGEIVVRIIGVPLFPVGAIMGIFF